MRVTQNTAARSGWHSATTVLVCSMLLATAVAPPATAERASDKEVRELMREIDRDLGRFIKAISPEYRTAIIRSAKGEADVGAFLKDLSNSCDQMERRMSSDYAASAEVKIFLSLAHSIRARQESGKGLLGAESEWNALEPRLERLASLYGIDWTADPSGWQSRRMSDGELDGLMASLRNGARDLGKSLKADLKGDKSLNSSQRKAILADVKAFETHAVDLAKSLRRGADATVGVEQAVAAAEQIKADLEGRPLSSQSKAVWSQIQTSLRRVAEAYGV